MKKVDQTIYQLFLKHGSECLWTCDTRVPRPKGSTEETDKMFAIIEEVDHRFEMIYSGKYSKQMIITFKNEIEEKRSMFTFEVFDILERKYKSKQL